MPPMCPYFSCGTTEQSGKKQDGMLANFQMCSELSDDCLSILPYVQWICGHFGGGYPPPDPPWHPRGSRVDFPLIFDDFGVSFGRPWGTPGLPFPSRSRLGTAMGRQKVEKNTTGRQHCDKVTFRTGAARPRNMFLALKHGK